MLRLAQITTGTQYSELTKDTFTYRHKVGVGAASSVSVDFLETSSVVPRDTATSLSVSFL